MTGENLKKFLLILVLIFGISFGLFYIHNILMQNNPEEILEEVKKPTQEKPVQNLLSDDKLIPYSDLPDYENFKKQLDLNE